MAEWLHFPIRWVDLSKADTSGGVEGYASVFNNVDQQDDVVVRGAFKRSLAFWKSSGRRIPLVADHDHSSGGLIGSIASAMEDPFGLRFRAEFSASKSAQDIRLKAKEKHLDGVSIFGDIKEKSVEYVDGRPIRVISEIQLMEISLTPFPANTKSLVSTVKGGVTGQPGELDDEWASDMRAALTIGAPHVRKAAIDALVAARYPAVAITTPEDDDKTSGENTQGEDGDDASTYALSIIGESGPDVSPPGGNPSNASLADQLLASVDAVTNRNDLQALASELNALKGE